MAGEIRQKIVLEGEKEYNAALREAQRHLKTLQTALKAETAELGANATAQQKNEVRAKSLRAQIKEQEEVVKTLRQALEEAKEHYGDNEEVVARWEQKLNAARTTLANMKNDLTGLSQDFSGVGNTVQRSTTDVKSFADSLGEIGNVGSTISGAIESAFSSLTGVIREAAMEIWDLIYDTAAAADNYGDLASFFGSSAYDVQKWSRAIEAAGGDMSKLTSIVTKLAYGGKNQQIAEWFGVSDVNYTDDLQYTMDVLTAMSEKQEEMKRNGTWAEAISEIFGAKKAEDISWFMDNLPGADGIIAWAEKYAEEGWGMSDEELETMGDVYKQITDIQTMWNDLKSQWAAGFGEVTGKLLIDVQGVLGDLNAILNAKDQGERDAALQALREHLESFFTTLADAISEGIKALNEVGKELQESTDPTVRAIGDLLVWITDKLAWLADPANRDKIMATFRTIAAFWIAGAGAKMFGKIADIVANIAVIKAFNASGAAAGAAGAGAGGTAAAAAGGGLLAKIGSGLGAVLKWAGPIGAFLYTFTEGVRNVGDDSVLTKEEEDALEGRVDNEEALASAQEKLLENYESLEDYEQQRAESMERARQREEEKKAWEDILRLADDYKKNYDAKDFWQMFETLAANMDRLYRGEDNPVFDTYYDQLPEELAAELDKWYELFAGGATPLDLAGNAEFTDFMARLLAAAGMPLDGQSFLLQAPMSGLDFWGATPFVNPNQGSENSRETILSVVPDAIRNGFRGLKVEIDGQEAGRILMPYISTLIGQEVEAYQ